ncbi:multidrug efflux MFS transporter [Brenneria goodwinii]|uniref:MDR family MFS transporter n=1 Tax=Brenneria goodwinii TaxID=1109412 RepID=UPI000EF1D4AF|nr:MDR family MFS transporter [Brenneria goodwinii]MCG8155394.1 multidrug efflux MFS transporter [Brenneria goodwinii]MCG8161594.1 multidrug efflux MFS transporter [Brenneria goodwinii]MCG8166059.1 multidrug efflux MFS transporter [Brenneria goodwinii]MCG8169241.1 multidrug efflux MFS transporter [Brenneria goodwinii]MCG8175755.1 multidrug efflux MFS transporter [Brenneria goodwinii]
MSTVLTTTAESIVKTEVSGRQWCAIIGGLIGGFMAILDIQIANSSMKVIQGALSATMNDSSWLMTSYFTAEIVAIPLCGWLCQALGTGRYALWCIAGFLGASLLCSVAWNLSSMIVFRSLQGFSGGALIPISFRLIIEILPLEKRPLGMSLFSIIGTFAPAVGPALGGWLTDNFSWHAIFYINAIPAVLSWGAIHYALKYPAINWDIIRRGDFVGIFSVMLCLGTLEVILEKGGEEHWLESNMICVLAVISTISFIIFMYAQLTHPQPLINLRLFRDYNFSCAIVIFAMLGVAIYGTLFLVPYYLAVVHDYNASEIGTVVIWMGFPQLVILPFIPFLIQRYNPKYLIFIGFIGLAVSAFMDCAMDNNFAGPQMAWSMLIRALGQPFIMVPLSLLATRNVQQQDSASSAVLINIFRCLGGSCGTAILSTFFITRIYTHVDIIKTSLVSGSNAFTAYLGDIKALLIGAGLAADSMSVKSTAFALLAKKITRQSEIMAFNDLFLIMGGMMLATALLVMFSSRDFRLLEKKEEKL